ncbi:MAG TPA: VanZ family protein, partial [Burkholderiaceae bacterium]|nr:VanZ family protein [Burkholderiaceae bacterium]
MPDRDHSTPTAAHARPRARARLSRVSWVLWAALILGIGLAPWSGWRDQGLSPWAFITAPLPQHYTAFDLTVNIVAFAVLGALGVIALAPRWRGYRAVLIATAVAAVLSVLIEALQTYLPPRIPSNLDLWTNLLGALMGAALLAPISSRLRHYGQQAAWRTHWFTHLTAAPLLVLTLWPLAQVYPTAM